MIFRREPNVYYGTNSILKLNLEIKAEEDIDLIEKYVGIGFAILKDWEFGITIEKIKKKNHTIGLILLYRGNFDKKAYNYYKHMKDLFCNKNRLKNFGERFTKSSEMVKILTHRLNLLNLIVSKTIGKLSEDYKKFLTFYDKALRNLGKSKVNWKEIKESLKIEKVKISYTGNLEYNFIVEI